MTCTNIMSIKNLSQKEEKCSLELTVGSDKECWACMGHSVK